MAADVAGPNPAAAAAATLYVDGKHGSDSNTGRSWDAAFRTINHAARQIPRGSAAAGWTVVVRGYVDHVYRERPVPGGYDRWGSAGSPVVFMAEGWAPGSRNYVRPIVSGGQLAPRAGRSWQPDATTGVWHTAWEQSPVGFDAAKPYSSAIFQNRTRWLWQRASLADLRAQAGRGGGYWYDEQAQRLYVATRKGVAPGSVTIDVPTSKGFYFDGSQGASYISIRGFVVRHAEMGIAFHLGTDHSTALDNVAEANFPMGYATSGRVTANGADPAQGNEFLRNSASYNTLQGFKIDAGSRDTRVCRNTVSHNGLQGVKVQGPADGPSDPRVTSGTEICRNQMVQQAIQRPGRKDERPNGLTISNGAARTTVHHNTIRGNLIGVQVNQGGIGSAIPGTRFTRNRLYGNQSVGLSLRDGVADRRDGTGSLYAAHNLYWNNGIGIRVHPGSSNKTFEHETVYASDGFGVQVGCGCSSTPASVVIRSSLVTHSSSYGIRVAPVSRVSLSHVGLPSNKSGAVSGSALKTEVNVRAAGYLSTDQQSVNFLRVGPSSYQYTAGPGDTPIGALY